MSREIEYKPLSHQKPFHLSTKPKVYLSSGFGAGKTYSLVMKAFQLMHLNQDMAGGILCPSIKMYKRDVYPTIKEICYENGIPHQYNKTDLQWYFPDARALVYIFHSEDEGASIRGPNLAWGCINEVTLVSEMAFKALISRIRKKEAKLLQLAMSGTPESFNWCYEYFIQEPRQDTDLIFGNSAENIYNADSYIQMLRDSYDELMQQQYIDGKFVNLTGKRCAYAFDRFKHTADDIDKLDGFPVYVSLDFNVDPMAATLWNRLPGITQKSNRQKTRGAILRAWDQIRIPGADTYDVCKAIREKTFKTDQIAIFPDPAGASRSTKVKHLTDIDILESEGFTDIRYKRKISVRNCLNALNAMFNRNEVIINRVKCPDVVADLEQCVFRQGVFEIDKTNLKRSHWLDGLKNMVDYEFPIKVGRGFREVRYR